LTQSSTVSYAFSCHTIDTCGEEQDVESGSTTTQGRRRGGGGSGVIACCLQVND
jgi:hypothetical protein